MKTLTLSFVGVALLSALASGQQGIDTSKYEMVDLSHAYGPTTLYWPTSTSKFTLHQDASGKTEGGCSTPRIP